jgi:hypothetical protein
MSDPLRIALVAEGPTDGVVLEAALRAVLGEKPFVLNHLQPEGSLAFGPRGGGWVGVYRWCKQAAMRGGGRLGQDQLLFGLHDALVIHTDADVAGRTYGDGAIEPGLSDLALPCELACPPAYATTNALRRVVLSWCGEKVQPARTVLCLPSKSTEAWVVAALYPDDAAVGAALPFECYARPETRLGLQPKRHRIRKSVSDYRERAAAIHRGWGRIAAPGALGQAQRFQAEMLEACR